MAAVTIALYSQQPAHALLIARGITRAMEVGSSEAARAFRLQAQGLVQPAVGARPGAIVASLCGIQAQDLPGARLSLWARSADLRPYHLDQALQARDVVRTWAMRGTLHLLAAPDVRWVIAVLAPAFTTISARHTALGLDEQTFARALAILRTALQRGQPRTRAELGEELRAQGVAPDGQRLPHILGQASFRGVICQGPPRGTEPTYVLLDAWLPPEQPLDRMEALGRLARRYLAGHGPAALQDFAWWSGLPLADARTAWSRIQPEVAAATIAGKSYALLATARESWPTTSAAPPVVVRLLPGFDSYILSYKDRQLIVDPAYVKRVNAGGGILKPTVIVDGRIVGIWRRTIRRHLDVSITLFEHPGAEATATIQSEVARLGRFLGREADLTLRVEE